MKTGGWTLFLSGPSHPECPRHPLLLGRAPVGLRGPLEGEAEQVRHGVKLPVKGGIGGA